MDSHILLKKWAKILVKIQVKSWSSKNSQKGLDQTKQSATDALKTASKTAVQKTAEATDYLICNTNAEKIKKVSRGLLQNSSEADKMKQKHGIW